MRASGNNPLGMLLLAAPLIAVPLFAIFGIPQFAPGTVTTASSLDEEEEVEDRSAPRKKNSRRSADDLFRAERDEFEASLDSPDPNATVRSAGRGRKSHAKYDEEAADEDVPQEALKGWKMAPPEEQFADVSDDLDLPKRTTGSRSKKNLDSGDENLASEYDRSDSHPLSKEDDTRDYDRTRPAKKSGRLVSSDVDAAFAVQAEETPEEPVASPRKKKGEAKSRSREPEVAAADESEPASDKDSAADRKSKDGAGVVREEFTWRKANMRLQELGTNVKPYFTMDNDKEMYIFHCDISPNDTPNLHQKFEARGYEPMLAVYDVIRQIEEWSSDRQENVARHDRAKRQRP